MRIIHINRNIIQANAKHGRADPVVRVEDENGVVTYCMEVDIRGPSRMVYRPDNPRSCGAKLWIETEAEICMVGYREPFAYQPCKERIPTPEIPDAT